MATFDQLIAELTSDVRRVHPDDALQFCSNWCQSRLREQRARTHSVISRRPAIVHDAKVNYSSSTLPSASALHESNAITTWAPWVMRSSARRSTMPHLYTVSPFGTSGVSEYIIQEDQLATPRRGSSALMDETSYERRKSSILYDEVSNLPQKSFSFGSSGPPSPVAPSDDSSDTSTSVNNPGDVLHPPSSNLLARRRSVFAESIPIGDGASSDSLPTYSKTNAQLRRIRAAISTNFIFRDLDEEQTSGVILAMREQRVAADELVIRQGDDGELFYVVEEGSLGCYIRSAPAPASPLVGDSPTSTKSAHSPQLYHGWHRQLGKQVAICKSGTSFGELALMYGHPRAASVLALEPTTLWALDRISFRTIILSAAHRRRMMYENFLSDVPLLKSLAPEERAKVADALVSRVYEDGEAVVRQGETSDAFFFVEEGEAVVATTPTGGEPQEIEVGRLKKGQYFGGKSLCSLWHFSKISLLYRAVSLASSSVCCHRQCSSPHG
jgi:cAMP-dependent protein kinase regulator